jgi:hypothetical protein
MRLHEYMRRSRVRSGIHPTLLSRCINRPWPLIEAWEKGTREIDTHILPHWCLVVGASLAEATRTLKDEKAEEIRVS